MQYKHVGNLAGVFVLAAAACSAAQIQASAANHASVGTPAARLVADASRADTQQRSSAHSRHHPDGDSDGSGDAVGKITPAGTDPVWRSVQTALNAEGSIRPGNVLEVIVPRENLRVRRNGVPVQAYLQVYFDFDFLHADANTAEVDGDGAILDTEVTPLVTRLEQAGFSVSAIHRHLLELQPELAYVHYNAKGDPVDLATKMRRIVEAVTKARFHTDRKQALTLNKQALDKVFGESGDTEPQDVLSYSFLRAERITEGGRPVPSSFGAYTEFRFQALERSEAAVAAECCVTKNEIAPVLKALERGGLQIQVLHNHMTDEQPRLFFIHAWGQGNAQDLAQALKDAVVSHTNVVPEK